MAKEHEKRQIYKISKIHQTENGGTNANAKTPDLGNE